MVEDRAERRDGAILTADVAGCSRLMGEDEVGTLATVNAHPTELIEPCIAEHRGRVVKTTGAAPPPRVCLRSAWSPPVESCFGVGARAAADPR